MESAVTLDSHTSRHVANPRTNRSGDSRMVFSNDSGRGITSDADSRTRLKVLLFSLKNQFESMAQMDQAVVTLALFIIDTPGTGALAELICPYLDSIASYKLEDERLRLDQSIKIQERIVQAAPEGHEDMPSWLNNLCISYQTRFNRFDDPHDVELAIKHARRAVELSPDGDPELPALLNCLASLNFCLLQSNGLMLALDEAVKCQCRAVSLVGETDPNKPAMLHNLAYFHLETYNRRDDQCDIDKVFECYTKALSLMSDAPDAQILEGLGTAYISRYEHMGRKSDISQAIHYLSEALALVTDEDNDRASINDNLGTACVCQFTISGQLSDIDMAIQHYTASVDLTNIDSPELPDRRNKLGTAYEQRFEYSRENKDIELAIKYCTWAIEHSPDDHVDKSTWLDSLGVLYHNRYKRFGDSLDIREALRLQHEAVALAEILSNRDTTNNSLQIKLNNLGSTYLSEFERTGHVSDIDASITYFLRSLDGVSDKYTYKHLRLNNLGLAYLAQCERLNDLSDADEAVECLERAVELVPHGHKDKIRWIGNLGNSYGTRFQLSKEEEDINKAIDCHTKMLKLVPERERFGALDLIGSTYYARFEQLNRLADLDEAIKYYTQAEVATPKDHAEWYSPLCNLGRSYLDKFRSTKQLADLKLSIEYLTRVVSGTSDEAADKAIWLVDLGDAYFELFKHQKHREDLVHSIEILRQAVTSSGYPSVRFQAAYTWVHAASNDYDSEIEAFTHLMALIPHVIWLGIPISRRYKDISPLQQDIIPRAVTVAIKCGDLNRAIEWFEAGRSVVWKQNLQLRTPVEKLRAVDANLAETVEWVAKELDQAASRPGKMGGKERESASQKHHRLAQKWDELLERVHRLPGFEDFLKPSKISTLVGAAKSRTIVVIANVTSCCDALIIRHGSTTIEHLHLSTFSHEKAVDARGKLVQSLEGAGIRQGSQRGLVVRPGVGPFHSVLAMLWEHVVRPVLDYLGYLDRKEGSKLPHISWCTTGPLSFLPLHAAGIYGGSHTAKVFDYVVSSYTPTLSTLIPASEPLDASDVTSILAVGQADAQGAAPLPGTIIELAALKHQAQHHGLPLVQLDGPIATSEAILSAMDSHTWVHLACHAIQNTSDPRASAFQLHDGPLDLSTMTKYSLRKKGLAFLSACQTATGDEKLPDEAVHLAAGMLMVGYSSVIATMWSINDQDAPKVAERVYEILFEEGRPDCTSSARALHEAVSWLRKERGETAFANWVPYIHIGI